MVIQYGRHYCDTNNLQEWITFLQDGYRDAKSWLAFLQEEAKISQREAENNDYEGMALVYNVAYNKLGSSWEYCADQIKALEEEK